MLGNHLFAWRSYTISLQAITITTEGKVQKIKYIANDFAGNCIKSFAHVVVLPIVNNNKPF